MTAVDWNMVFKDWQFVRLPMLGYAVLGLLAAAMIGLASGVVLYVGVVLIISVIVIIGIHFVFGTIIFERSKQTLPFMLSLPVTFLQYSRNKMVSNLLGFGIGWLALTGATALAISGTDQIPNGMIPFAVITLGELAVAFVLLFAIAMVLESEAWTIVVMTVCNIGISIFMHVLGGIPGINAHMGGAEAVWNSTALGLLAAEAGLIIALIAGTLFLQSRKTDYL
ncbi:MAG: hypothetical protein AAGA33_00485 [Pseudomonadota bacterium]